MPPKDPILRALGDIMVTLAGGVVRIVIDPDVPTCCETLPMLRTLPRGTPIPADPWSITNLRRPGMPGEPNGPRPTAIRR